MLKRILVLDINAKFYIPTREFVPILLKKLGNVTFFGPGYVDRETLKLGFSAFIAENGPYDVVFATEHVLFAYMAQMRSIKKCYSVYHNFFFGYEDLQSLVIIRRDFEQYGGLKIALLMESDYYNFQEQQIQMLQEHVSYCVGYNNQLNAPVASLSFLKKERFASHATDTWFRFVEAHKERIIAFPAFVHDTEFSFLPLGLRKHNWVVPGTPYWARREAFSRLEEMGECCKTNRMQPFFSVLNKLKLRPLGRSLGQVVYQTSFRNLIQSSKYCYTCGSGLGYPVRKFFEIPALGSVLVCMPCNGFEALGFENGVNAIVAHPNEIPDVHAFLEAHPEEAQGIADAGRKLVWEKHTVQARAAQLAASLDAILSGSFKGSYWEKGEFCLVGK